MYFEPQGSVRRGAALVADPDRKAELASERQFIHGAVVECASAAAAFGRAEYRTVDVDDARLRNRAVDPAGKPMEDGFGRPCWTDLEHGSVVAAAARVRRAVEQAVCVEQRRVLLRVV